MASIIKFIIDIFLKVFPKIIQILFKPKLKILAFDRERDINIYTHPKGDWIRKFVNLHIEYRPTKPAEVCYAILRLIKKPRGTKQLANIYYIHWADVPYSYVSRSPEPINIFRGEARLDVAFTHKRQRLKGCWLAIPLALSHPFRNQAFLPPGEYEIEIEICSATAKGDKKKYRLTSPKKWEGLNMEEL